MNNLAARGRKKARASALPYSGLYLAKMVLYRRINLASGQKRLNLSRKRPGATGYPAKGWNAQRLFDRRF
jgi:hypothetical protein